MKRHLVLPDRGVLLVSTDVHGNEEDVIRLDLQERPQPGDGPFQIAFVFQGDGLVIHPLDVGLVGHRKSPRRVQVVGRTSRVVSVACPAEIGR